MTKSYERGENEVAFQARQEALRRGKSIKTILGEMLAKAKSEKNKKMQRKIVRAQKYMGVRNRRERKR